MENSEVMSLATLKAPRTMPKMAKAAMMAIQRRSNRTPGREDLDMIQRNSNARLMVP